MSLHALSQKLTYARIRLNCKLAMIQPQEVLDGFQDIAVRVPFVSTHWETASLFDHMFIGTLARVLNPKLCFEIGTSLGLVTSTLAANTSDDTEIYTLDLSDLPRIGSVFKGTPGSKKITQHFGPSTQFNFKSLPRPIDLMFIDGSHEAEDVVKDSRNAFNALSDRGVILWHDVSAHFPGVVRGLESLPEAAEIYRIYGTGFGMYARPKAGLQMGVRRSANRNDEVVQMSETAVA